MTGIEACGLFVVLLVLELLQARERRRLERRLEVLERAAKLRGWTL